MRKGDRAILIFPVVQIVGCNGGGHPGKRGIAPNRNGDGRESRTYTTSGRQRFRETSLSHFAATYEHWAAKKKAMGAMFSTTLIVATEHGGGDQWGETIMQKKVGKS